MEGEGGGWREREEGGGRGRRVAEGGVREREEGKEELSTIESLI